MKQAGSDEGWTKAERWAWEKIAAGEVADFGAGRGKLDPRSKAGWDAARTLRAGFLRALLFDRDRAALVPIAGVRICGARFRDALFLTHADLKWPLCLEQCRFEGGVDLTGLRIEARLSCAGSAFAGGGPHSLALEHAIAGRRVDLSNAWFGQGIAAANASFAGALDLTGATVARTLDLTAARAGSLSLRNANAARVLLRNCEVEQDVDLSGAIVTGAVTMTDIRVGQELQLQGSETRAARFAREIDLNGAVIGGSMTLIGASVAGPLSMNSVEVKKNLFLRGRLRSDGAEIKGETLFAGTVNLTGATIRGSFELLGATFRGIVEMNSIDVGRNLSGWGTDAHPTVFHKALRLDWGHIAGDATLDRANCLGEASFIGARIDGKVSLRGARFAKKVSFADARIDGHFVMSNVGRVEPRCKAELVLQNCTIGGQAEFSGRYDGPLTCSGLRTGAGLFMRSDEAGSVNFRESIDLRYARIGGVLDFDGATLAKGFDATRITVGQELRLDAKKIGGPINLSSGDIGGSMTATTAVRHEIDLSGIHVAQDLRLGGTFGAAIKLSLARIDRVLDISKADFSKSLDLTGSTIGSQVSLRLPPQDGDAVLDLRDARSGSLQVSTPEAIQSGWPRRGSVQLDGFVYDRLGGVGIDQGGDMADRPASWFIDWLALDEPYSPQPYEHLANILRQAGENEKANLILYEGRERARASATWLRWFGLTLLWAAIGYGIGFRFFRALYPAAVLTVIGVLVLGPGLVGDPGTAAHPGVQLQDWLDKAVYSFDQLLPFIKLNPRLAEVRLPAGMETYFYIHRFFGYLLSGFIGAGIAGLTQRSKS